MGLLAVYMIPVVFLAEQLARPVDYFIETLSAPVTLGGMIIALLVATPKIMPCAPPRQTICSAP